jgi:hypothetical protein
MNTRPLPFPSISKDFGLAPEAARVVPRYGEVDGVGKKEIAWPLTVDGELTLDFGRKVMGKLWIHTDGPLRAIYATDREQLAFLIRGDDQRDLYCGPHETYAQATPWHDVGASERPQPVEEGLSVFRLLNLKAERPVRILDCWLDFSAPHAPLDGGFSCDDEELNQIWHMGVYTTLLCTQNNEHAVVPVPAPGDGYVIWDGPRRDREVWGGDLRPASLTWMYAYGDSQPVRNSLYMLWQARHVGCAHTGMVPGSAGTHQTFYEWTFWYLVNAWEYYLHRGDTQFLRSLMAPGGLDLTLDWVKRQVNERGLVEATNSWMYTLKVGGEMAALAIVQVAGLEALARLFLAGGQGALADEAHDLAATARKQIPARFFDGKRGAFRMLSERQAQGTRYPLDANAWAVLYAIGDRAMRQQCLAFLRDPELRAETGLRNFIPPFDNEDDSWYGHEKMKWLHNETVWPYPNASAAWAWFHEGEIDEGVAVLKAFHRPHITRGHATLWEGMMADGCHPVEVHSNMMSMCHAWGGAGSYLLQRFVLGVSPVEPGFATVRIVPQLGSLKFARGTVPTPHGPIVVDVKQGPDGISGRVELPEGVAVDGAVPTIDYITRSKAT